VKPADRFVEQAIALHQRGLVDDARRRYQQALKLQPRHFDALHLLGVIAAQNNRPEDALELIDRAIAVNPRNAAAHSNRGNALRQLQRFALAVDSYDRAIALKPHFADALGNRGAVLLILGRHEAAIDSLNLAIAANPSYAEAFHQRGAAFLELDRYQDAMADFQKAISLKPGHPEAHGKLGYAQLRLGLPADAVASFERAATLKPSDAEVFNNRGYALFAAGYPQEAAASCSRAIEIRPDYAEAYNNRGIALAGLKRVEEALEDYRRALDLQPQFADAHNNLGILLAEIGRRDAALASYRRAIALRADFADAHNNCGILLSQAGQYRAAIDCFDNALRFNPDLKFTAGMRLHAKMQICDWSQISSEIAQLCSSVRRGAAASPPFALLGLEDSAELHRQAAEVWVRETCPDLSRPCLPGEAQDQRIRIGYFSADLHEHATAFLMAGLFETHDRSRFELTAFSFGPESRDAMRMRLEAAFDRFIDVRDWSDARIAEKSREMRIDIAIDLKGFTQDSRPAIFAARAAPLQVSYLGFPGTLGAPYIDYLIADSIVIPETSRRHYREKIIYLPNSYQVNDAARLISERSFTRHELDLPDEGFVFCCFNNNYKILPALFDRWVAILKRVDNSVLWLLAGNPQAAANLRAEAASRGLDPQRLRFAPRMAQADHLARHRAADLFLDTLPCNAHTTASDALWAGLPVLTCAGESFAARVAASVVHAVGLPELVCSSMDHYEELGVALALDPDRLSAIKQRLAANRRSAPLFDTPLSVRHLEAAYRQILERHRRGLPAEHVQIAAGADAG